MNSEIILSHLAFALLLFLLLPVGRLPVTVRLMLFAGAVVLGIVPYAGLSLATYLRSLTDDLAITTLSWLAWCAGTRIFQFRTPSSDRQHGQLALCFAVLALLLYPATLGLSSFDPYRLGYSPRLLLGIVFAIGIAFWFGRHYLGAAMLTLATVVFTFDIKQSENYWDYLVDPLLGMYCAGFIVSYVLQFLWQKIRMPVDRTVPFGIPANFRWKPVLRGNRVRAAFSRSSHPATSTKGAFPNIRQTARDSNGESGSAARSLPAHPLRNNCYRINQKAGKSDLC